MFGWIRRLFGGRDDGPGYTCDGCETRTPRSKGKALVEVKRPGVFLFCPDCAELKLYAKKQAEMMRAAAEKKRAEEPNVFVVDADGKPDEEATKKATEMMERMQEHAYGEKTGRVDCSKPNKP